MVNIITYDEDMEETCLNGLLEELARKQSRSSEEPRIAAAIKTQRRKIKRSFWERSDLKRGRWPATENWGAAQRAPLLHMDVQH